MAVELLTFERTKCEVVLRLLTSFLNAPMKAKSILEIGCSTGILLQMLEEQGGNVLGVDVPSTWADHYAYKPEKRVFLDLQQEDPRPEWERSPFDLVIAQEVIEHIERPYDFLRRVWRVVKPGGYLFLTTPNLLGITAFFRGRKWCGLATEGHVILYSAKSLDFTVGNCGFRPVRTFTNIMPIYHQARHPWLSCANRALMWTGAGGGLMGFYQKRDRPADFGQGAT
jgi:2-polyprenyl-3-methyl-5-hydroxy-6-metoxy-1,4-benzoquinol methylase